MTERINGNLVSLNKNSGNYVNGGSYPPELRQRLLIYLIDNRNKSCNQIARKFMVSKTFVWNTRNTLHQSSFRINSKRKGRRMKDEDVQYEFVRELLLDNPRLYLREIRHQLLAHFNHSPSVHTIHRITKRLGFSRKKLTRFCERRISEENLERRCSYLAYILMVNRDRVYFFDESYFNLLTGERNYGRSVGRRILLASTAPFRGKQRSLLATIGINGFVGIDIKEGSVNGEVLFDYFYSMFETNQLPKDSFIVMDNCPFHRSIRSQLETLFSIVNTKLVFLPPYSPDLSPIENSFGKIKLSLKNHNITNQDELYVAMLESIATVTPENIRGWYSHCGYHY